MKSVFWTAILISTLVVARARAESRVVCEDIDHGISTKISFVETSPTTLTDIRGSYSQTKGCEETWENVFLETKQTSLVSITGDGARTFNLSLEDGGGLPWTTYTIVIPAGQAKRFTAEVTEDDAHEGTTYVTKLDCTRE